MLHVNEDNNDELFRKAAEGFFLKAGPPDWDDLNQKMEACISSVPDEVPLAEKKITTKLPLSIFKWLYDKTLKSKSALFRLMGPVRRLRKSKKKIDLQSILSCTCTQLQNRLVFVLN